MSLQVRLATLYHTTEGDAIQAAQTLMAWLEDAQQGYVSGTDESSATAQECLRLLRAYTVAHTHEARQALAKTIETLWHTLPPHA